MAGYSKTPLVKKLGIKEDYKIALINHPENYFYLLGSLPEGIKVAGNTEYNLNLIHYFTNNLKELEVCCLLFYHGLCPDGIIWIS